jgi:hypothetical protein
MQSRERRGPLPSKHRCSDRTRYRWDGLLPGRQRTLDPPGLGHAASVPEVQFGPGGRGRDGATRGLQPVPAVMRHTGQRPWAGITLLPRHRPPVRPRARVGMELPGDAGPSGRHDGTRERGCCDPELARGADEAPSGQERHPAWGAPAAASVGSRRVRDTRVRGVDPGHVSDARLAPGRVPATSSRIDVESVFWLLETASLARPGHSSESD